MPRVTLVQPSAVLATVALVAVALVAAALVAAPAAGDWLVTSDGTRIETRGPWQVKGSQVVFTSMAGRLQALRAADVDLEASAAATRAAAVAATRDPAAAATAAEPVGREPKKPTRKWTDEDIPAPAPGEESEPDEAASEEEAAVEENSSEPVRVQSWSSRESEDGGGLEIVGTLRNTGEGIAADIRVRVKLEAEEGEPPFDARAFLEASALVPGQTTSFRVLLPGIYALPGDPSFEVTSDGFSFLGPQKPESPDDGLEEAEEIEGGEG